MVFVSHDLGVIRFLADLVMVMYRGRVVESGPTEAVLAAPLHPYVQLLCDSARAIRASSLGTGGVVRADGAPIQGADVLLLSQTLGCAFAPRCRWAEPSCEEAVPTLESVSPDRQIAYPVRRG